MSDDLTPETVSRRLGTIERLLNVVLERHAQASVKDRERLERAIEKVGLDISEHRRIAEATGKFFSTERVLERHLDETLFMRGQTGWEVVSLTLIPDEQPGLVKENLYLVVFRQEDRLDDVP